MGSEMQLTTAESGESKICGSKNASFTGKGLSEPKGSESGQTGQLPSPGSALVCGGISRQLMDGY